MAKWLFSGCTNNIGNLVISANTIATEYTFTLSGMCYVSVSATTEPYDILNPPSLVNKNCGGCTDFSVRISGCSGEGVYILGAQNSTIYLPTLGQCVLLTGQTTQGTMLNGCFEVIEDGHAPENIYMYAGDDVEITGPYIDCPDCLDVLNSPTPTPTPTITPTIPSVGCYSGTTNGNYSFVDCCNVPIEGNSIGQVFCVNTSYSHSGIIISNSECNQNCNNGILDYTFELTGTCRNSNGGIIEIIPEGGVLPYTIENITPGIGGVITSFDTFIYSGLSSGDYVFVLNDSSGGVNQSLNINVNVSGCLDLIISSYSNGLCNISQGTITVSGSTDSIPYELFLYKDSLLSQSAITNTNVFTFNALNDGEYYVYGTDFGGASAETTTQIITGGSDLDFTYSITGQSTCYPIGGIASVDSVTGSTPYTYDWFNGQTGSTATGLTQGYNSVMVTDALGCSLTKEIFIPFVGEINVVQEQSQQATCFNPNGTVTITITGGTAPYYYSGSTGQSLLTNNTEFTLTGLTGGVCEITIEDSGFCSLSHYTTVPATAGFTILGVNTVNSQCNENGQVQVSVGGANTLLIYELSGETGNIETYATNSSTHTFENVESGNYIVSVSSNGNCEYEQQITITNVPKLFVNTTTTNTSCNDANGSVLIEVFSGETELQYPLSYVVRDINTNELIYQTIGSNSAITVNNLTSNTYIVYVTDNNSCQVQNIFSINESDGLSILINKQNCTLGLEDGSIEVVILEGNPTFTYIWSSNVPSTETGPHINNLSGGTYTVTVIDSNGCRATKTVVINCDGVNINNNYITNICENIFTITSGNKRSFQSMLEESFQALNIEGQNCVLVNAIFTANLSIIGDNINENISENFYTGYTLTDVPTDNLWADTVEDLLNQITGITQQQVNLSENKYSFVGICEDDSNYDTLSNAEVNLNTSIDLNIDCVSTSLPTPTPTPTITSTITPTPTITSTITPTPTITLTPTPTQTGPVTSPQALIFVAPNTDFVGNSGDLLEYMFTNGASSWYGFNYGAAGFNASDAEIWMDWPGFVNGTANGGQAIETTVNQSTYLLDETLLSSGSVPGDDNTYYAIAIPTILMDNDTYKLVAIGYDYTSDGGTDYTNTFINLAISNIIVNYSGSNWYNGDYRVYYSNSLTSNTNSSFNYYWKGNDIE